MKADYVHKDTLTATDYVELNKNNELLISYNQVLLKENKKLKQQLHEASLTIQEMTEQDIECPSNCEKLKILKEQLEEYKRLGFKYLQDKNNDLETQQKEFIKYLENEKDRLARICNNLGEDKFDEADDILQKYKEIIGGKCES